MLARSIVSKTLSASVRVARPSVYATIRANHTLRVCK